MCRFSGHEGASGLATGANMGELMSNDVQSHEDVAERVAGEERRASVRHAARSLGSVTARIIGGSEVDLVNFSNRGVLFECDSRLLIGARTSVRITTPDDNLIISGAWSARGEGSGQRRPSLRCGARARRRAGSRAQVPRCANASDAGSDADVLDALESEPSIRRRGLPRRIRGVAARGGARGRSHAPHVGLPRAGRRRGSRRRSRAAAVP